MDGGSASARGEFQFDENRHEPGTKKVLGKKIKEHATGRPAGVAHCIESGNCTIHLRKLAVRFVSDDPPQSLVDRLAKSYMSGVAMLPWCWRTLFHSPEFWSAEDYSPR